MGLVAVGHKTKEMRRKEERSLEHRHNLDREKRQIKREKGTGKGQARERKRERTLAKALKYSETRSNPTSSSGSKNAV
jgi:hypothetical protein